MRSLQLDRFTAPIDTQIAFNQGKNILLDKLDAFQFTTETVNAISNVEGLTANATQYLIDYATNKAIEGFCSVNQYYSFSSKTKSELRQIYSELFESVQQKKDSVEHISKEHYNKLKHFIKRSNPFAEKIYTNEVVEVKPVACAEYSPELQLHILKLDSTRIRQAVLDIGCGIQGHLVNHLNKQGVEAYGIDRFRFTSSNLITADWLEYDYGNKKWGTIVSNLGFSNHFMHHNLRADGNYVAYGKTYMRILNALKVGGCFHYAPDLPFIEAYLDQSQFALSKYEINNDGFKTTVIKRIK